MKVKELKKRPSIEHHKKLSNTYAEFESLLAALRKKSLPQEIVTNINTSIDQLNSVSELELRKSMKRTQSGILKILEKELKIVCKNHYRNLWLVLGMSVFGIPLGVTFGAILGNMALLGIGLPIGMAIGLVVGSGMDKRAVKAGRQLDIEIKH